MTRARGTVASALAVAVALTLGACADRSRDGFAIVNKSDTAVTVTFVDGLTEVTVEPGHREVVRMPECLGTAVHVTAEGHPRRGHRRIGVRRFDPLHREGSQRRDRVDVRLTRTGSCSCSCSEEHGSRAQFGSARPSRQYPP